MSEHTPSDGLQRLIDSLGVVDALKLGLEKLQAERDIFKAALEDIATRFSVDSKHFVWAASNECECVVCVAREALERARGPK